MALKQFFKARVISSLLALATFIVSVSMSYFINGSLFSTVPITTLSSLGITHENILNLDVWRFFTAQLIHVKYPHMIFNVVFLFPLACEIEKKLGRKAIFSIWLIGGGVGTYCSSFFVPTPWNIGTGASQAVLAIAMGLLIFTKLGLELSQRAKGLSIIYIAIAMTLDIVFAGHPKLGHLISMGLGILLCYIFVKVCPKKV